MTNTLYYNLTTPSGAVTGTISATAEEMIELDVAIASNASEFLVNFAAVRATTKTLWMKADQNLTIKTNSSGSPADTITLVANTPYLLFVGAAPAFLPATALAADVTKLYVTNTSDPATATTLKIRSLQDPTP